MEIFSKKKLSILLLNQLDTIDPPNTWNFRSHKTILVWTKLQCNFAKHANTQVNFFFISFSKTYRGQFTVHVFKCSITISWRRYMFPKHNNITHNSCTTVGCRLTAFSLKARKSKKRPLPPPRAFHGSAVNSATTGDPTNLSLSWKIFVSSSFLCRNIRFKQLDIGLMINAPVGNYK